MIEKLKEFCAVIVIFLCLIGFIALFGLTINFLAVRPACYEQGRIMNLPSQWHLMSGCYIQTKRGWVPSAQVVRAQVEP